MQINHTNEAKALGKKTATSVSCCETLMFVVANEEIFGRSAGANRLSTVGWPRFPRDSDAAKCLGADVDYDCCYLKKTTSPSSRVAVVVSQQPAEPLVTLNFTVSLADFIAGFDELVGQPLVVSFAVIMGQVRGCRLWLVAMMFRRRISFSRDTLP